MLKFIYRLYDTLDRRIDVWREVRRRRMKDAANSALSRKLLQALYFQRMLVALDIASAIKHLHKLEIIFRDLKPDNGKLVSLNQKLLVCVLLMHFCFP